VTDIASEYRIITTDAGWARAASIGWIRVSGADRASFLHALLTNDVESLQSSRGVPALYLTPQGRMIADLRVLHRGDSLLAAVVGVDGRSQAAELAAKLDALIFAEDARVEDASAQLFVLSVTDRGAPAVLARAFDLSEKFVFDLPAWAQLSIRTNFVMRVDELSESSWWIVGPAHEEAQAIDAMERAGAKPVSAALIDALRIEAARPLFGADMTSETIPLEAGQLDRSISQTKGCYVGQEVIVRVLHRGGGRVARLLVRLDLDSAAAAPPEPGSRVLVEDADVGAVTSAARSPATGGAIALAYLKREHATIGTVVTLANGDTATVAKLS
jgi:folate-binding protein YgfZ